MRIWFYLVVFVGYLFLFIFNNFEAWCFLGNKKPSRVEGWSSLSLLLTVEFIFYRLAN